MVGLIGLGLTLICLVGAIIQRLAPAFRAKKPKGFHYPIARAGFDGSLYFNDYDYFELGLGGVCVCETCSRQRFAISCAVK